MKIVDAHIHMWNLDDNYYPWLSDGDRPSVVADYSSLRRNYLASDFAADCATLAPDLEVIAAVHIQAEHDPRDHVRETRWLQGVADSDGAHGKPQAIVANADLAAHDAQQVLEEHCAFRNVRGIRQALHRRLAETPAYDPLDDPAFQKNFGLLERFGLSFDLQFFAEQGVSVQRLVQLHPGVQFILTHAGMPLSTKAEAYALWRSNMQTLARHDNVAVKISGFGLYDPQWTTESIAPVAGVAAELFGPARCMLASNFPVERIHRTYAQVWRSYVAFFNDWSAAERMALFCDNARRYYRIDPSSVRA